MPDRSESEGISQDNREVESDEARRLTLERMLEEVGEDGLTDEDLDFMEQFEPEEAANEVDGFYENLAEKIDDEELGRIAGTVIEWFDWDHQSRYPWYEREVRGLRLLGVTEKTDGGAKFAGASRVVHPVLMEACIQFQARAMGEIWPSDGPVKTMVVGDGSEAEEQQAKRVAGYMNYSINDVMPGAYEAEDKSKIRLPLSGSVFKKVYTDPIHGPMDDYVAPEDFVVPYNAECLRTAQRYTHVLYLYPNDVKRYQLNGHYVDVELTNPDEIGSVERIFYKEVLDSEGQTAWSHEDKSQRHTVIEMHVDWDLKGHEHKEGGKKTGLELPYVITVSYDDYKVLSIRRNWQEDDEQQKKKIWFTHDKFVPGFGFYGWGYIHLIGNLATAATGALRAMLDAAHFANQPSGYAAKGAKGLPKNVPPGEYAETDFASEDLKDAFYDLPYKDPSSALFNLLGYITDSANRIASTTDTMVGEGNSSVPVGTTLARIEQGEKIYSAIHRRLHRSKREEWKLLAEELKNDLPKEGYPFAYQGVKSEIAFEDFDDRVDIIPISDPAVVSSTQRMFQGQLVLEVAEKAPQLYDMRAVHKRALVAARVQNIDELMPPQEEAQKIGPIQENMALLLNKPIKAFPDEDHVAHQMVHQHFITTLQPEQQEQIMGAHAAHMAEHEALKYYLMMTEAMGADVPSDVIEGELVPIEQDEESAITMAAARAVQLLEEQAGDPEAEAEAAKINAEAEKVGSETQIAQEKFQNEEERADEALRADIDRKDATATADTQRKNATTENDLAAKIRQQEADLVGKE
jgi:chaperonin GroES